MEGFVKLFSEKNDRQVKEGMERRESLKERLRTNTESRMSELLEIGYITTEEAESIKEASELPTERKKLIALYAISEFLDASDQNTEDIAAFRNLMREKPKEILARGGKIITDKSIRLATDFVENRRYRLREALKKNIRKEVALSLLRNPNAIASNGFRADSLSGEERKNLEDISLRYLDSIELAVLNGEYELSRNNESDKDKDPEGVLKLDTTDIFWLALKEYYNRGTAQEMINFVNNMIAGFVPYVGKRKEDTVIVKKEIEELGNSKFKYLIEEGLC